MKKHSYLLSSVFLLTTFFGFEKANSYDFDKGFNPNVEFSRSFQNTNNLITVKQQQYYNSYDAARVTQQQQHHNSNTTTATQRYHKALQIVSTRYYNALQLLQQGITRHHS